MYKNYKIIKEQQLTDINAFGTLLTHNKSGAKVLLLKNDDKNKSFCIGFRTPPYDNTGLPHILEHSVLCGSRKFPVKEPFVELMKSSLNTFLNAMTFADKTLYPIASCNDKDFKNLMDVYMDAVLYPNIHIKEEIFKQEGWHYELDSVESEIVYNGVVYNEMKGAFSSPDGILERESLNSLFPETTYGVESGGNPDFIPTLTYEKFKEFHKKYYHPSNSYIILYGNCDMKETLKWLDDEYLSKFDKIEIDSKIKIQKPLNKTIEKELLYPVSQEQGTNDKTLLAYNVAFPAYFDTKDSVAFEIITQVLLKSAGAPLKKVLLDNKIGDVVEGSFESGILQPIFSICTKNTNVSEKDNFINTIENCLKEYVTNGLNKDALLAAINNYEFKLREADFGGMSKGLIYTINCFNTWLYDDENPFTVFDYTNIFEFLKKNINTDYFENLIDKYLLNNNHKSIVICKPSLEIQEQKENELKEKLAEYKASLSETEIKKIIEDTISLKQYQAKPDTKEDLDTIPLLKKEDLSLDVLSINNNEELIDNVKVLHHDYQTNKIAYMRLLFDMKDVPASLYPYLGLFKCLLGSLDTKSYNYDLLEQSIMMNTGGIKESILTYKKQAECKLHLLVEASALYNNIDFVLDIINEIIDTTNFDNKKRVKECIAMELSNLQQSLVGGGHVKAMTRALSYTEENSYINDLVEGIGYFHILSDLMKSFNEKYDEIINKMVQISKYVFTKDNILLSFTGDAEGYNIFKNNINKVIKNLGESQINNEPFIYIPKQLNEGFKSPFDVNFVALTGNFKKNELPYLGSLLVFENVISTDYLWKEVRVLGGAYGCMCGFWRSGAAYFVSYRDPNVEKTLETYKGIIKYIDEFEADDEAMLKFIIGAVGNYDYPKSPSNKGRRALLSYLQDITESDYLLEKQQIINTNIKDIKAIKKYIISILEQNNICVLGNDKKVEESKKIFNVVEPLFK